MTESKIPTLAELLEMTPQDRYEYLKSVKAELPSMYQIARDLGVSATLINTVFGGISKNQKVLNYIVDKLNDNGNN